MIYLSNDLKDQINLKENSINFLDFLGTKYKIEEIEESIFLQEDNLKHKKHEIDLYVYGKNMKKIKKEILEFAEAWKEISLCVTLNGLVPGEKYYPIHSPICYRGYNWIKELGEKTKYPFGSSDKKEFIKWYKINSK